MKKYKYTSNRALSVLLAIILLITALSYIPVNLVCAAQRTNNPIQNGSFEYGLENWETYFNEQHSGNAEVTPDYRAAINLSFFLNWYSESGEDQGPVNWSTQLSQKNIRVERDKEYKIKFTASSTVERPIAVSMVTKLTVGDTSDSEYIIIGPEEKTYEIDYTPAGTSFDLTFLMGQFTKEEFPEMPYTTEKFKKHTIYISDVRLVGIDDVEEEPEMKVIGVEDGETYKTPVSVKVNYKKPYTLELKKDGTAINYTEGEQITRNGNYTLTVTDKADSSVYEIIDFKINLDIDYSKEWVVISNKSTNMVMETSGSSGKTLVQGTYTGKAAQFFSIEDASQGYVLIRSMTSGEVLTATVNNKLETAKENDSDWQLWQIDDTVPQGYVKFVNKRNEYAIGVTGASKTEGQTLSIEKKSSNSDEGQQNNDAQRWDIISTIDVKEAIEGKNVDISTQAKWESNAIVTPVVNGLNPAGEITVEFYPLEGTASYSVYFDDKKAAEISKTQLDKATINDSCMITKDGTIKIFNATYSTEVAKHTLYIQTDTGVKTDTIEFYISKRVLAGTRFTALQIWI